MPVATTPIARNEEIDLTELAGEFHRSFEEILTATGDAEEARQLGHDDGQPRAGLEADQDAIADQPHQNAEPQQPGDQAKQSHGEGREAGDLGVVFGIAPSHCPNGSGEHQRDRGGRPDCQLSR
jgi:hypothetical protein